MPDTHVHDDLGAYAAGALDPRERAAVEAHIARCELCRDELAAYRQVTAALAKQVPIEQPPPGTWDGIATRLHGGGTKAPLATHADAPIAIGRSRLRLIFAGWAATAAVLAAMVGWTAYQAFDTGSASVQDLASSSEGSVIPLAATNSAAVGRLYISDDESQGGLAVNGMPTTPSGKTYQLWFITPDQTWTAGGTFEVDAEGRALVKVRFPGPVRDFSGVTVCTEPPPGSPTEWGDLVLSGPVYE
jgi:anti-sigma-K factor RskA